jgi:hypothetical protein
LTFNRHERVSLEQVVSKGEVAASAERALGEKARAAIRAGMLPREHQVSTWGGPGSGAACAVCGDPVPRDGLGFEPEFRDTDGRVELRYVHIPCFAAWDSECRHFLQAASDGPTIPERERDEQ